MMDDCLERVLNTATKMCVCVCINDEVDPSGYIIAGDNWRVPETGEFRSFFHYPETLALVLTSSKKKKMNCVYQWVYL